jgi:predicted AlkP superfamily pyrophosphatase or phosphodiesterase
VARVLLLDVVGLTPALLAHAPRLAAVGPVAPLTPPLPAVTCTSQAAMLTGRSPRDHGIVGNGWLFRDLNEVWFWRQSSRLVTAPKLWEGFEGTSAVLFWWFNMATSATWSITPRPAYFADGRKLPDVYADPPELGRALQERLGSFPLFNFWGPLAGIESTRWIASAAVEVLERQDPDLCLVYLPHLDYDLQRLGPEDPRIPDQVRAVDAEAGRILDAAGDRKVYVVSEYGMQRVTGAIHLNRHLREAGLLEVIDNPVGELLDPHRSKAFAVCDHQLAHVYTRDEAAARAALGDLEIVDKETAQLDHPRSGELVVLAPPGSWFAYPYWLDDARAPDFARTVDIHRKPGYDPVELFSSASALRVAWLLARKKLGFRTLLDVVPLDAGLVKGSHGRPPDRPEEGPLLIGDDERPRAMTEVYDLVRRELGS